MNQDANASEGKEWRQGVRSHEWWSEPVFCFFEWEIVLLRCIFFFTLGVIFKSAGAYYEAWAWARMSLLVIVSILFFRKKNRAIVLGVFSTDRSFSKPLFSFFFFFLVSKREGQSSSTWIANHSSSWSNRYSLSAETNVFVFFYSHERFSEFFPSGHRSGAEISVLQK